MIKKINIIAEIDRILGAIPETVVYADKTTSTTRGVSGRVYKVCTRATFTLTHSQYGRMLHVNIGAPILGSQHRRLIVRNLNDPESNEVSFDVTNEPGKVRSYQDKIMEVYNGSLRVAESEN